MYSDHILMTFKFQEERLPLQMWVTQKSNGMLSEEGHADGNVSAMFTSESVVFCLLRPPFPF